MTFPNDSLREQKAALRRTMRAGRMKASLETPQAAERMRDVFLHNLTLPPGSVIAATAALPGEMNPAPLCAALVAMGHVLCLPCVTDKTKLLTFRVWAPGAILVPGAFGVFEPPASAPETEPDVLLVPLLAFDRSLNRLGHGGGYYDKTLKSLRRKKSVMAIGLAFAAQEVLSVPVAPLDEPLDAVMTEREAVLSSASG